MNKSLEYFFKRSQKPGRLLALLLVCGAAGLAFRLRFGPNPVSAQSPVKLWSVDLGSDKDFHKRLSNLEMFLDPPSIDFINGAQIICGFYDDEKVGFNPSLTPHGYHVLEINAQSGAFGRKLDFQSVDDHSRALPVADGGFIVLAGHELTKYSAGFLPGPSYPTPIESPNQRPDLWLMDVAPGGQTVLLYHHLVSEEQGKWAWLHARDLTVINSVPGPLTIAAHASDRAAILYDEDGAKLFSAGKITALCDKCDAHFLTSQLVFLGKERAYFIETIAGDRRASGDLDVYASVFNRSSLTTRFVYSTGHYIGHGLLIQTNFDRVMAKIIVLDWSTNKPVSEIDVNEAAGNPSAGLAQMALALSPDGKFLAVMLHHTLSLYQLP